MVGRRTADRTTILWCDLPASLRQDVAHQWLAQYPDCQLRRLLKDPVAAEPGESWWVADICLDPAAYPIQTFAHFEDRLNRQLADPLAAGLASVAGKGDDNVRGVLELDIRPADHQLVKRADRLLKKMRQSPLRLHPATVRHTVSWGLSSSWFARQWSWFYMTVGSRRRFRELASTVDPLAAVEQKMHSPALFTARMRLFVRGARSASAAQRAMRRMISALGPFALPRGAMFRLGSVRQYSHGHRTNAVFTADELATLWHPATVTVRAERFAAVQSREWSRRSSCQPVATIPRYR